MILPVWLLLGTQTAWTSGQANGDVTSISEGVLCVCLWQ